MRKTTWHSGKFDPNEDTLICFLLGSSVSFYTPLGERDERKDQSRKSMVITGYFKLLIVTHSWIFVSNCSVSNFGEESHPLHIVFASFTHLWFLNWFFVYFLKELKLMNNLLYKYEQVNIWRKVKKEWVELAPRGCFTIVQHQLVIAILSVFNYKHNCGTVSDKTPDGRYGTDCC